MASYGTVPPVNGRPFTVTVPVGVAVGGGIGADDAAWSWSSGRRRRRRRSELPGIAAAVGKRKLPLHDGYERDVTPFAVAAAYDDWPGAISIVARPPFAAVSRPTCTAAVHTELSSV